MSDLLKSILPSSLFVIGALYMPSGDARAQLANPACEISRGDRVVEDRRLPFTRDYLNVNGRQTEVEWAGRFNNTHIVVLAVKHEGLIFRAWADSSDIEATDRNGVAYRMYRDNQGNFVRSLGCQLRDAPLPSTATFEQGISLLHNVAYSPFLREVARAAGIKVCGFTFPERPTPKGNSAAQACAK